MTDKLYVGNKGTVRNQQWRRSIAVVVHLVCKIISNCFSSSFQSNIQHNVALCRLSYKGSPFLKRQLSVKQNTVFN